jgi:hypothetical protein
MISPLNIPQVQFFGIPHPIFQTLISYLSIFGPILHPTHHFSKERSPYSTQHFAKFTIQSRFTLHYSQYTHIFFAIFAILTPLHCKFRNATRQFYNIYTRFYKKIDVKRLLSLPHTRGGGIVLGKRKFQTPAPLESSKSDSFSILSWFMVSSRQSKRLLITSHYILFSVCNPVRIRTHQIKHRFTAMG